MAPGSVFCDCNIDAQIRMETVIARSTYYTTYTIPAYYKYVPAYYSYTAGYSYYGYAITYIGTNSARIRNSGNTVFGYVRIIYPSDVQITGKKYARLMVHGYTYTTTVEQFSYRYENDRGDYRYSYAAFAWQEFRNYRISSVHWSWSYFSASVSGYGGEGFPTALVYDVSAYSGYRSASYIYTQAYYQYNAPKYYNELHYQYYIA